MTGTPDIRLSNPPTFRRSVPFRVFRGQPAGRRLAEEHYDVHKVNQGMLQFMGLV